MNQNNYAQKIEQLKKDSEFIKKARNANSTEEFLKLLSDEGIEVSSEFAGALPLKAGSGEELVEQDLEVVAGGMIVGPTWSLINWWKNLFCKGGSNGNHGGGGRSF